MRTDRPSDPLADRLTISPKEAAALLGLGRRKIGEMLLTGELPGFRIGRVWRIPVADLRAWIDRQARKGGRR